MNGNSSNWTKDDLKAYLLIYCANADFKETSEELQKINSVIGTKGYHSIKGEFNKDTDYERIQKINSAILRLEYSKDQINQLFVEIKEMFLADGEFAYLEKNLLLGLKRLLK